MFWIYHNGKILPEDEVRIPITDRSYLYGEGLFETMLAHRGKIPFFIEHMERLQLGMQALEFSYRFSQVDLQSALEQLLHKNDLQEASLRLSLSRENTAIGQRQASQNYHLIVFPQIFADNSLNSVEEIKSYRVTLETKYKICSSRLSQYKTSNYLFYLDTHQCAREAGFDEALICNNQNEIIEGTTTNLFCFLDGQWITPSAAQGPLLGVGRRILIELMKKNHIAIEEKAVTLSELKASQTIVLTNAIHGPIFVKSLNEQGFENPKSKSRAIYLKKLWLDKINDRLK
ncbi:MAG: aminotransferase class IV [Deltaproteobacteria bacterium]|nr:aminotransferase class IV [Deltaproteobacteria bacterium]